MTNEQRGATWQIFFGIVAFGTEVFVIATCAQDMQLTLTSQ